MLYIVLNSVLFVSKNNLQTNAYYSTLILKREQLVEMVLQNKHSILLYNTRWYQQSLVASIGLLLKVD